MAKDKSEKKKKAADVEAEGDIVMADVPEASYRNSSLRSLCTKLTNLPEQSKKL